jgi:putative transposase
VRACRLTQFSRAAWYRSSQARDQTALRLRIRELAHARPCFGYLRIWVLLRREGWPINRKRVRRLYRFDGLQMRVRVRRRKHMALHRGPAPAPAGTTERWSMDFVHDALADGRPFRVLTVVDQWSRHRGRLEHVGVNCQPSSASRARRRTGTSLDHRRSWDGVSIADAGRLGVLTGRPARFHPTGQTR